MKQKMALSISPARLVEVVAALPEYELDALALMRERRMPETPEEFIQYAQATAQIVQYGERSEMAIRALYTLTATPIEHSVLAGLVEDFPL